MNPGGYGGGYYMGGDRDDHGNYSSVSGSLNYDLLNQPQEEKLTEKVYKDVFGVDFAYLEDMCSSCSRGSRDYYVWQNFTAYAKTIVEFYANVMSAFYNLVLKQTRSFGYNEDSDNIADLSNLLMEKENQFLYALKNRSCQKFCAKNKITKKVKSLAVEAWTIYHVVVSAEGNAKADLAGIVKSSMAVKKFLDSKDEQKDICVYRNAVSMDRKVEQVKSSTFMSTYHSYEIYADCDILPYLNKLMSLAGGIETDKLEEILNNAHAGVLKSDFKYLIKFYNKYNFIIYLIDLLNYDTKKFNEGYSDVRAFRTHEDKDVYKTAEEELLYCQGLLEKTNQLNYKYIKDIKLIIIKLVDALKFSKEAYKKCSENWEEIEAKTKEFFDRLKNEHP